MPVSRSFSRAPLTTVSPTRGPTHPARSTCGHPDHRQGPRRTTHGRRLRRAGSRADRRCPGCSAAWPGRRIQRLRAGHRRRPRRREPLASPAGDPAARRRPVVRVHPRRMARARSATTRVGRPARPRPDRRPARRRHGQLPRRPPGGHHERRGRDHPVRDTLVRMPTGWLADVHATAGGRTWVYDLSWNSPGLGAGHGLDIPLIFGNGSSGFAARFLRSPPPGNVGPLSDRIRRSWTAFAATGDPGRPTAVPGSGKRTPTTRTIRSPFRQSWQHRLSR